MVLPLKCEPTVNRHLASQVFGNFKSLACKGHFPKNFKVRKVRWNNSGTKLCCIQNDRFVTVWHAERPDSKAMQDFRTAHERSPEDISWDPLHSDLLATVAADGQVFVYNTKSKSPVKSRRITERSLTATSDADSGKMDVDTTEDQKDDLAAPLRFVKYSPNGRFLALGLRSDHIVLLDALSDNLTTVAVYKESDEICDMLWSNSSDMLFTVVGNGQVNMLNVDTNSDSVSITLHHTLAGSRSRCIELDSRGKFLVVGTREGIVNIWDTSDWTCISTLTDVDESIAELSISGDGIYLAVAYENNDSINIYDLYERQKVHSVPIQVPTAPPSIMWNPLRNSLALSGDSNGVTLFVRN